MEIKTEFFFQTKALKKTITELLQFISILLFVKYIIYYTYTIHRERNFSKFSLAPSMPNQHSLKHIYKTM